MTATRGKAPLRTLVAWCPDWPVVAAGRAPEAAAAVMGSEPGMRGRVLACSEPARAQGVRQGMRRREAEGRCPGLDVVAADPDGEARAFEAVVAAVASLTPRVEVLRPGTLALPTRGPSRYFGGDHALVARAGALADAALEGRARCRVGMADGLFAAILAARRALVVEPGASAAFLAPLAVANLAHADPPAGSPELIDLFRRLGLRCLGDVAAMPSATLAGRFGPLGARVSRLCRGLDDRPPRPQVPPPDLTVAAEIDPPATQVAAAGFVARRLATELGEHLAVRGLACARVCIEAETEHGETLARRWRTEGLVLASALVDRVRWQLDGWCHRSTGQRPSGGITLLRLVPEEVTADRGRQLGFWGEASAADERAARGIARLQGLLGPEAVTVPQRRGGRSPGEQVVLVAAHAAGDGEDQAGEFVLAPWPGRLPAPAPSLVHAVGWPAEVVSAGGEEVDVSARGLVSAAPDRVSLAGGPWCQVRSWAGPWPMDERWWDPATHRRRARIQVVTAGGEAHLLALSGGRWVLEATYD
ncbi:DNA polymerase Y family protein [soil metagenome]